MQADASRLRSLNDVQGRQLVLADLHSVLDVQLLERVQQFCFGQGGLKRGSNAIAHDQQQGHSQHWSIAQQHSHGVLGLNAARGEQRRRL